MEISDRAVGSLSAILDALGRDKAVIPTAGGVLIELDSAAYTFSMGGEATMVCDADDMEELWRVVAEARDDSVTAWRAKREGT